MISPAHRRAAVCLVVLFSFVSGAHADALVEWGRTFVAPVPALQKPGKTVAVGSSYGLVLHPDGTLTHWGSAVTAGIPAEATGIKAIAAGHSHCLAVKPDGKVIAWGRNTAGQCAVPERATNVTAVAAGESFSAALKADGTVVVWGSNQMTSFEYEQITVPNDLTDVAAIAAGDYHVVTLLSNGTVRCFGWDNAGQSSVPAGLTNVSAVAAGGSHSLALRRDGKVIEWGFARSGAELSSGGIVATQVKAIFAGFNHDLLLRSNGIVQLHDPANVAGPLPLLANVISLAAGQNYSVALISTVPEGGEIYVKQARIANGIFRVEYEGTPGLAFRIEKCATPDFAAPQEIVTGTIPETGVLAHEEAAGAVSAWFRILY